MTGILSLLFGAGLGIFLQVGGGILAAVFDLTPWLTLWWGIGVTAYILFGGYRSRAGRPQPHRAEANFITAVTMVPLWTVINFVVYCILRWLIHMVRS